MKKTTLLLLSFLLIFSYSYAATITAVTSGNWSSNTTWGGALNNPGSTVSLDDIVIPAGITITLDVDISIGLNSSLTVGGNLVGSNSITMLFGGLTAMSTGIIDVGTLDAGLSTAIDLTTGSKLICQNLISRANITGSGSINAGIIDLQAGGNINMSGGAVVQCDTLFNNGNIGGFGGKYIAQLVDCGTTANINLGIGDSLICMHLINQLNVINIADGTIKVTDDIELVAGAIRLTNNATIDLSNTCWLTMKGGRIRNLTSTDITNVINVRLSQNADTLSNDLSFGIANFGIVEFNFIDPNHEIILGEDAVIQNVFNLNSGILNLDGKRLTLDGDFIPVNGLLQGNINSDLIVGGAGQFDTLSFAAGSGQLANFNITRPGFDGVLGSDLNVSGTFELQDGAFEINGSALSIAGDFIAPAGAFLGSDHAALEFSGSGVTDSLRFVNGFGVFDFVTFNRPAELALAGNLVVDSSFVISGGTFDLGANQVLFRGDFDLGNEVIEGNPMAVLAFEGHGAIDTLDFDPANASLFELNVNTDTLVPIILGSDLQILGTVFTTSGEIELNGTTLTISGTISKERGLFVGDASASIVIEGVDSTGILAFKPGFEYLNGFTVNRTDGTNPGTLNVAGNLTVEGLCDIQEGTVAFGQHDPDTTQAKADTDPTKIYFNSTCNASKGGFAVGGFSQAKGGFSSGGGVDFHFGSDLITTGDFNFFGTPEMGLYFGNGSVPDTLNFAPGYQTIGDLVSETGLSIILGTDLTITDTLSLTSGDLVLNDYITLTVSGTLILDNATLTPEQMANLILIGSGQIDTLMFDPASSEMNNFTINMDTDTHVIYLGCDLTVNGELYLASGELYLEGDSLILAGTVESVDGTISGTGQAVLTIEGTDTLGTLVFTDGYQELKSLVIDRAGGYVTLGSDLTIDDLLVLSDGLVELGDFNLYIDTLADISNYWKESYVMTSGSGELIRIMQTQDVPYVFPVGSADSYSPAYLTLLDAASLGAYAVSASDSVFANGTTGANLSLTESLVNQTWNISTGQVDPWVNVALEWYSSDAVNGFNNDTCRMGHNDNSIWHYSEDLYSVVTDSGSYRVTWDSVHSFSPFSLFSGDLPSCVMTLDPVSSDAVCFNESTGMASVSVYAGTAPFEYLWSDNSITELLQDVSAGMYLVTVTDRYGCQAFGDVLVGEASQIVIIPTITDASTSSASDGVIDIAVTGGTGVYTFEWNDGAYTTEDLAGIVWGDYFVTVTDENGCTMTDTVFVDFGLSTTNQLFKDLAIYPNPTAGVLHVENIQGYQLDVYSIEGMEVFSKVATDSNIKIDLTGYSSGVYQLIFSKGGERISRRIILH